MSGLLDVSVNSIKLEVEVVESFVVVRIVFGSMEMGDENCSCSLSCLKEIYSVQMNCVFFRVDNA